MSSWFWSGSDEGEGIVLERTEEVGWDGGGSRMEMEMAKGKVLDDAWLM